MGRWIGRWGREVATMGDGEAAAVGSVSPKEKAHWSDAAEASSTAPGGAKALVTVVSSIELGTNLVTGLTSSTGGASTTAAAATIESLVVEFANSSSMSLGAQLACGPVLR